MNIYERVEAFYRRYGGAKLVYGRSREGRNLYAMFLGRRERPVGIAQYAIHGREYVTSLLALGHIQRGLERGGVWVLPLTNPDGALLSEVGLTSLPPEAREALVAVNGGSRDFSLWKANAAGVDLNVNFDARWGTGIKNVFSPAPENYVGRAPLSEPESAALARFTERAAPAFTVSFHTKGEEIYWRFHQPLFRLRRDRKLAEALERSTGYPLREAKGSAGGYKDWCIGRGIPAFTVECGREDLAHPLTEDAFGEIAARCGGALRALTEAFDG